MFNIGPWDALTKWLKADGDIAALAKGGVHRRQVPATVTVFPYVLIGGPDGFDNGNHSTGSFKHKIARFPMVIASEAITTVHGATAASTFQAPQLVLRVKNKMQAHRNGYIGVENDFWVNAFLLKGLEETSVEHPVQKELLLPAIAFDWQVDYNELSIPAVYIPPN